MVWIGLNYQAGVDNQPGIVGPIQTLLTVRLDKMNMFLNIYLVQVLEQALASSQ